MKEGDEPTLDVRRIQGGTVFGPDPSTLPPAETPEAESTELPVVDPRHYKILGEHARGGMGRVLIARDVRLGRLVAIKELLAGEKEQGLRFLREVLLTARLQHPSIVPIHEAGQWPTGKPFYAMKLVSGRPLGELIRGAKTLADRLALLRHILDVSEAISYAHSMRIIHRDLKPSNVIVGDFGETVVIDWGLAKDISDSEGTSPDKLSAHTVQGAVVGTPGYMPPEQAFGRLVDERADVYALGSLLYTVLSGRPPYDGTHPPDLVAQVKTGSPVPLAERDPAIPPDLCAIVDKAMARNPDDRYLTALGLAEDLRRFETGQLVAARAYSRTELVRRWLRRNRSVVTVIAAAAVAVIGFIGFGVVQIVAERDRADRERTEAVAERQRAEAARAREAARVDELTLAQARAYMDEDPTAALAWLKRLRPRPENAKAARLLAAEAYVRGAARFILTDAERGATDVAFSPAGGFLAVGSGTGVVKLWNLGTGTAQVLKGQGAAVGRVRFSPDGRQLAAAEGDKLVRVWDVGSGGARTLSGHTDVVEDVDYSPDGKRLASGGRDGTIRLWDVASGQPAGVLRLAGGVARLGFSPDGKRLAARVGDALWSVDLDGTARPMEGVVGSGRFEFDPAGTRLAAGNGREAVVWEAASGRRLGRYATAADAAAFSPDGKLLATASRSGAVYVIDIDRGGRRELVDAGNDPSLDVTFSPDGHYLAATHGVASRIFNLDTGDMRKLRSHALTVTRIAFGPQGKLVATASVDGSVRVWQVGQGEPQVVPMAGRADTLTASDDGSRLALVRAGGVWLGEPGGAGAILVGSTGHERKIQLSPDGRFLAATEGAAVRLWDLSSGSAAMLEGHTAPVTEVAFAPAGDRLATAGGDGQVRVSDLATREATVLAGHVGAVTGLAFPRDDAVVSAGDDATVRVWSPRDRSGRVKVLRGHEGGVAVLIARGGHIATYGHDRQLRLWNLAGGEGRMLRLVPTVGAMAFSPSGRALALSEQGDRQVHLWDGDEVRSYLEREAVSQLAFIDDDLLVVGGASGGLWLRSPRGGAVPLLGHRARVAALRVFPRARAATVASVGDDETMRIWTDPVPPDGDADALRGWLEGMTSAVVGPDDRVAGSGL